MKVAHIIDSGGFYGAEVMLLNLCIAQQQQGIEVEVISIGLPNQTAKPVEVKLLSANIPVKTWHMPAAPDLRESIKIIRYCKKNHVKVIHSHGYKGNILLGLLPKFLRSIPIITTVHGYTQTKGFSKLSINQWLDRKCLRRLDAVVLVSPSMTHQIPIKNIREKVHIVANGIPELECGNKNPVYESLFVSADFKIGTLGRLSYEKNFRLLIQAMPKILLHVPNAKLIIYGEGNQRAELELLIEELKLSGKVLLPGYLQNTQAFFSDIDVFVNCSITEGMPISLLEAMRQGCHIVATDIPASRFLLEDINTLQQLCDLTPESLSASIVYLSSASMEQKQSVSTRYSHKFKNQYTSALMAKNYLDIYRSVQ